MNRTNTTQLPNSHQLNTIIQTEVQRKVPKVKENIHYPDFSLAIELLKTLDFPSDFFTQQYTPEDIQDKKLLENVQTVINELTNKILHERINQRLQLLLNQIYDYLSEEDKIKKTDIIFVFGSKTLLRIEKAVELYKAGYAPLLLISGGNPIYQQDKPQAEAEIYKTYAVGNGVPESAIITETESITLPDNVRSSLNLLDKKRIPYKSFILVNSPYVQRRGWVLFKKYISNEILVYRSTAKTIDKYTKENWYKNKDGLKVALNEFVKMRIAVILNTS